MFRKKYRQKLNKCTKSKVRNESKYWLSWVVIPKDKLIKRSNSHNFKNINQSDITNMEEWGVPLEPPLEVITSWPAIIQQRIYFVDVLLRNISERSEHQNIWSCASQHKQGEVQKWRPGMHLGAHWNPWRGEGRNQAASAISVATSIPSWETSI